MRSQWRAFSLVALFCLVASVISAQTAPLKTIDEILAAFMEQNGGEEGVEEVRSIRARGTILFDGELRSLTILRKRPNLKRISVRFGNTSIHRAFNGEVSWRMFEADDGRKEVVILEGAEKERFELDQSLLGRLYMTAEEGVEHEFMGVEYVGRIPAYVVDSTYKNDVRRAYLDSRTLRVLKYEYDSGSDAKVLEVLSEYTRVGKIWVAKRSERFENGEPAGVVELDRIELNNGVFEAVFDVPQEAR